jgi:hypothetical protein
MFVGKRRGNGVDVKMKLSQWRDGGADDDFGVMVCFKAGS